MNVTIADPALLRAASKNPDIVSVQSRTTEESGHLFKVGETCTLTGLVDFPEFNGQKVKITAFREGTERGRAYYIDGEINQFLNWVYEYRLQ